MLNAPATATSMRFGPVEIAFDDAVLRPRPWTLAQSEWAAALAGGGAMLELGCGAGQIGLAAAALSGGQVVQVDRDPAACRWAAHNAEANGYGHLVEQRCGTPEEVVAEGERFGVVIADPPYVPSSEVGLYPEDPLGAIDGGPDGLDVIRSFLGVAVRHLGPTGRVILQVRGTGQAELIGAWLHGPSAPPLDLVEARTYGETRALALLAPR